MKQTIKGAILHRLQKGVATTSELIQIVGTFYQSKTGMKWGQQFLSDRVSETLYRLVDSGKIRRVQRGLYQLS